jgi:hypothetical protein
MIGLWKPEFGMKLNDGGYRLYVKRYTLAYFMVWMSIWKYIQPLTCNVQHIIVTKL